MNLQLLNKKVLPFCSNYAFHSWKTVFFAECKDIIQLSSKMISKRTIKSIGLRAGLYKQGGATAFDWDAKTQKFIPTPPFMLFNT